MLTSVGTQHSVNVSACCSWLQGVVCSFSVQAARNSFPAGTSSQLCLMSVSLAPQNFDWESGISLIYLTQTLILPCAEMFRRISIIGLFPATGSVTAEQHIKATLGLLTNIKVQMTPAQGERWFDVGLVIPACSPSTAESPSLYLAARVCLESPREFLQGLTSSE